MPFLLSYSYPLAVTLFIFVFDVYWLVQTFNYSYMLIKGYRRLYKHMHTNWQGRLDTIAALSPEERAEQNILDPRELYNAIILTTYREDQVILEASIESIIKTGLPKERRILVLATEERDEENSVHVAAALEKKYRNEFFKFIVTRHPDGIVGEVKAKGANATWAARELTKQMRELKIPLDHVIVSTADADTRFDSHFFACLTYAYCVLPDRTHCSFQPVSTYFNNIWKAPMMSRVLAFGTTFWQLIESVREYRLITFATHAVSLKTLVDIDYWCTSIVNEDSRQYFRAFFHYEGKFRVVPLYIPIYMDAVHVNNYWDTFKNLYFQQQRWAYGVEHFPYIVLECVFHKDIPLWDRIALVWRAFQGAFSWATSSFFVTFVGWIPILLNDSFRDQVVVANFIGVTQKLLSLTWVGLIISGVLTLKVLTLVPHRQRPYDWLTMIVQWILVPIFGIFFGAIPGIHAQTRLMLGKYLGFRVTEKSRPA